MTSTHRLTSQTPTMAYRAPNCDGLYPTKNPYQDEADKHGVPLIPKLPPQDRGSRELNPVVAICGECGRKVHAVEGYYCGNGNCPIQPHSIC